MIVADENCFAARRATVAPPVPKPMNGRPTRLRGWRARLRAHVPSADELARVRWLRPVAHHLADHRLWHARPESLARGAAIGIFWAFAAPFAQIVLAAAHCIWWRGNIPVAVVITFITNPFTVGFWLYLAYRVGSWLVPGLAQDGLSSATGLMGMIEHYGWAALAGMAIFAVGGSVLGYFSMRAGSRLWFHWRFASRARRRQPARNRGAR
jgi:uncharacterized protein